MDIIEVLKEFEGIIGAVLGVIATLVTTELIKKIGKVDYEFKDWKSTFYGTSEYGDIVATDDVRNAEQYSYETRLQIYNSSETIKIVKDIYIEFCFKDKIIKNIPYDKSKTVYKSVGLVTSDFRIVNIPPKQIIEIELGGSLFNSDIEIKNFAHLNGIYFVGKNYKGKEIRKLIK